MRLCDGVHRCDDGTIHRARKSVRKYIDRGGGGGGRTFDGIRHDFSVSGRWRFGLDADNGHVSVVIRLNIGELLQ